MRRFIIEDAETMAIALQQEIIRSEDARYDHRLHGMLLLCRGLTIKEVCRCLGQARRTVHYWIERFKKSGFAGLKEGERSGRPASLNPNQLFQLGQALRKPPRKLGFSQNFWDGKLVGNFLKNRFGITLQVRQCQRLFHKLGFRQRKPRSLIAHADPVERAVFKKTP